MTDCKDNLQEIAGNSIMDGKTLDFIKKSRNIYGLKYGYEKVKYINNRTKVCIFCPIHGYFWQVPKDHLRHRQCKLCSNLVVKEKTAGKSRKIKFKHKNSEYNTKLFKIEANKIHNF